MGTLFEFRCNKCDYTAEVSGGKDCGMVAVVRTMVCRNCRELVDVTIGRRGREGLTGDADYDRGIGICPRCNGAEVTSWGRSRPCPRCDGKMRKGESTVLWD